MQLDVQLDLLTAALRAVRPALRDAADGQRVVRLDARGERLRLTATGRTMTIHHELEAVVALRGEVTVPARLFEDLAAKGLAEQATLTTDTDGDLAFESGGIAAKLRRQTNEPHPEIDANPSGAVAALSGEECRRLATITFACSKKAERPVLTGVHLGPNQASATDTYRIARTELADWELDVVVPADILELAAAFGEDVAVLFDGRVLRLDASSARWSCPVLASGFPRLNQFFEGGASREVRCNRASLSHAVSTAAVLPGASLDLFDRDGSLVVRSETAQLGTVEIELEAAIPSGSTWSFSASYLRDAIEVATDDEIVLQITDRAAIIRCSRFEQFVLLRV